MSSALFRFLLALIFLRGLGELDPEEEEDEELQVCLLQTSLVPARAQILRELQRSEGHQRTRQPECFEVSHFPAVPPNTDPGLIPMPSYWYLVAATDDIKTNPYSWAYAKKRNVREYWTDAGFILYWQESDSQDAPWTSIDLRNSSLPVMQRYYESHKKSCPTPESCWSAFWHVQLWEGYPLLFNWCCQEDMVGNEVFWAGGQTASKELMAYVDELIANQTGGLQKFPVVPTNTGSYSTQCPWGGGQSGEVSHGV